MPLTAGIRLGPYEIVSPLGAGGMGEVWRARDTRLGREVAIKALPAEFARDPERLDRFEREAQTLASLNHANIAAIYGLETSDGVPHLVLELVDGETLADRLARGALPTAEALRVGVQVAAAIAAAHERGVIHRDLKPGNVMLTASGTVKVLDFGLAKSDAPPASSGGGLSDSPTMMPARGATMAGVVLGTAAYMSPEQARGKAVDRRSDVWSFGCLLFECFAGRAAFTGETTSDLIGRILEREPDWSALPSATPPKAREILKRCLRKDAEERPRDIRDVGLELAEIAAGGARGEATHEHSIAVLPFDNLGAADDGYFADGMTDEILNALAHVDGLRVAARSSCFAFKGKREDPRIVGEKLDVAAVLEGSVRRAGERLRITVQLVNAADGYQLWSERYDREATDVFAVQDEIATTIVTRLKVSFHAKGQPGAARRGTSNLEAYELLLKGRAYQTQRGRFIPMAIACFEQAIALDPEYAEAFGLLADGYRLLAMFDAVPSSQVMEHSKEFAQRALALDPLQPEALATIGSVQAQYDRDYPKAAASWGRALELDPRHTRARCERALWGLAYRAMTPEDAVLETDRAVAEDPLNAWASGMQSFVLAYAGKHAESIVAAERAVSTDPDNFWGQWNLIRAHAASGNEARALELVPMLLGVSGRHQWALGILGWLHGKLGDVTKARAIYDELEARSRSEYVGPFWLATAAGAAGLMDEAMRFAERAIVEREPIVVQGLIIPVWDSLRADPRFESVKKGVWG